VAMKISDLLGCPFMVHRFYAAGSSYKSL
jgi:hypothetical protein